MEFAVTISDTKNMAPLIKFLAACHCPIVFLVCPKGASARDMEDIITELSSYARIILTPIAAPLISHYNVRRYTARMEKFAAMYRDRIMAIEVMPEINSPDAGPLVLKKAGQCLDIMKRGSIPTMFTYAWHTTSIAGMVPWVKHFAFHHISYLFFSIPANPPDWTDALNVAHNLIPSAKLGLRSFENFGNRALMRRLLTMQNSCWMGGGGVDISIVDPPVLDVLLEYGRRQ